MGTLTLRLPEKLDTRLSKLAKLEDISRSELARTALEKFLCEMEREKFMAGMVEAARFLATNPQARAESLAIAEEFEPLLARRRGRAGNSRRPRSRVPLQASPWRNCRR